LSSFTTSTSWHLLASAFFRVHFAHIIVPDSVVSAARAIDATESTIASVIAVLIMVFMKLASSAVGREGHGVFGECTE